MPKNRKLFLTNYCLTPTVRIESCGILCDNDKVIAIGGASAFSMSEPGLEIVKMLDCYALPGFIDSHIHGIGGFDASHAENTEATLNDTSRLLAMHGVTTFLPTVVSGSYENMLRNIDVLAARIEAGCQYAEAHSIHVEGPFINPEKRGSQDARYISAVDLGFAQELIDAGRGRIKVMTFAPELKDSDKLVELMLEKGIIPSMGHSMATERDTLRAIDAGAQRCTYIFNAMPAFHQRESTLTTVALTDDRVAIEMIVDGAHLHPRVVSLITRCKPINKIIGISNATSASKDWGLAVSEASTGIIARVVRNNDGVLAGATTTLENSWFHLRSYTNMSETFAASCFTINPALDLGLITRGELRPGLRADITFFDVKTNRVRMTISKGKVIYDALNPIQ